MKIKHCLWLTVTACLILLAQEMTLGQESPQENAKRREHSTLFKKYGLRHQKLADPASPGDIAVIHISDLRDQSASWSVTPEAYLSRSACNSDAVVIGTATDFSSFLTENEGFIFTEFKLRVEEILKNNSRVPSAEKEELTIVSPGGELIHNGRKLKALVKGVTPFHTGGRYLLYLGFIPVTGAYQSFGERSFELRPDKVYRLTNQALWNERTHKLDDAGAFLATVRATTTAPCN
jgi:hypothetical protein